MSPAKQGSALLLTVLVVSLLLLVSVAFSAAVRMELRVVQNRMDHFVAESNARLGLELALNKLHLSAGGDRKVSARGDLLSGTHADAQLWTGVWSNDANGALAGAPAWLVSGTPSVTAGAGADAVTLHRAQNGHAAVRVPTETSRAGNGNLLGTFAYWVADEASKASLTARRASVLTFSAAAYSPLRRITEFQSDFGVATFLYSGAPALDVASPMLPQILERVTLPGDLAHVFQVSNPPPSSHDFTTAAFGVAENTRDGGLKANLSDSAFRDSFLATDETQKFLAPKPGGILFVEGGLPSPSLEGQPWFSPRPLMTEVVLYIGMYHPRSDARLRIRFHVQAEYLNPYSLPMRFPADTSSQYSRGMVLVFSNMPTITVTDLSGVGPSVTENLNALTPTSQNSPINRKLQSWVEIATSPSSGSSPELAPGEVYQVMEPDPVRQPRGLARDFGTQTWAAGNGTRPANNATIRISAVHQNGKPTVTAYPYVTSPQAPFSSGALPWERPPYSQIANVPFDDFTIEKLFYSGPNPFSRLLSSDYVVEDYNFAYHFRFHSEPADTSSLQDYLSGANVLDPDYDANRSFTRPDGTSGVYGDLLDPISPDPPSIVQDTLNLFSPLDYFMDGTARSHAADHHRFVLYDVPNGDTLSVGRLSSLPLYRRPPRSIGNPWGGDNNLAFDRYYFSPKIPGTSPGEYVPGNPAVVRVGSPSGSTAVSTDAADELVFGQFNIHSTSIAAWSAVLSGPILSPAPDDGIDTGEVTLQGAFFRLPGYQATRNLFMGQPASVPPAPPAGVQAPEHQFSQGIRVLTEAQVVSLASNIVRRLQSHGQPFPDMAAFVNSGIIRDAIADTVPAINPGLMRYANTYLTQADVLTKLAPTAAPRSDTFRVRVKGTSQRSAGDPVQAEAWGEALVQRVPEKTDGSSPNSASLGVLDARRYRILSFRWLTPDEI